MLELGEHLEEAVRREVREETGLLVEPVEICEVFESIQYDARNLPEYHYVLIDYFCRVKGGELRAGDDACRAEWVPSDELRLRRVTHGTLELIERALQRRKRARQR
jgi:ADP-ribose pyrophosphatase YjhB (NUDIX family)